jgi:uncharacterized membrane protein YkgB
MNNDLISIIVPTYKEADNIQPLVSGNPNTNFYNFHNLLDNKYTITSRSDIRSLEDVQNKTATEVMTQIGLIMYITNILNLLMK